MLCDQSEVNLSVKRKEEKMKKEFLVRFKKKSGEQNSLNETPGTLRSDIYEKLSHGDRSGGQN